MARQIHLSMWLNGISPAWLQTTHDAASENGGGGNQSWVITGAETWHICVRVLRRTVDLQFCAVATVRDGAVPAART